MNICLVLIILVKNDIARQVSTLAFFLFLGPGYINHLIKPFMKYIFWNFLEHILKDSR